MSWKNDQVSEEETAKILDLARKCLGVEGDFVELGCYKGDTSLLLADIIFSGPRPASPFAFGNSFRAPRAAGAKSRAAALRNAQKRQYPTNHSHRLYLCDSFEGLPEKKEADKSVIGVAFRGGELAVTKREVKERFLRAGLPLPIIKKGWFRDLKDSDLPKRIAFAFLDGDFYESIKDSLKLVAPKMASGGVLVVHDYTNPALPGVKKAVDEWGGVDRAEFMVVLL